jgi:hypothetical protein
MGKQQADVYHKLDPNIQNALTYLSPANQRKFRKAFRKQANDERLLFHTTRELFAGAFMVRQGYDAEYEPSIGDQTPDWRFSGRGVKPNFFADVVNFHLPPPDEAVVTGVLDGQGEYAGWLPNNEQRLYKSIQGKASKYINAATNTGLPLVVFVYGDFKSCLTEREILACLYPWEATEQGLFDLYPTLTGVCHMGFDLRGNVTFTYYPPRERVNHPTFEVEGGILPIPLPLAGSGLAETGPSSPAPL